MYKKILISFILFLTCLKVGAADDIRIGMMFGSGNSISPGDKVAYAFQYQSMANFGLLNSGITDRQFKFTAIQSPVLWTTQTRTNYQNAQKMKQHNALPALPFSFRSLRDTPTIASEGGYDIMLLRVENEVPIVGLSCGSVNTNPLNVSTGYSETDAFAVISDNSNCENLLAVAILHELGHILYSEHEDDGNNDFWLPSFKNHGYKQLNGPTKSIMHSVVNYIDANYRYSGGSSSGLGSSFSDVAGWIVENQGPWDTVAAYRGPRVFPS